MHSSAATCVRVGLALGSSDVRLHIRRPINRLHCDLLVSPIDLRVGLHVWICASAQPAVNMSFRSQFEVQHDCVNQ